MPGVGTTHHIALGGHYYLVRPGTYRKGAAPQFGARFSTGDPDYNNLSFWQHWSQRCWVGGMDATEWADDAMFDTSVGINSTEHERMSLARDLAPGGGSNWAVSSGTSNAVNGYKTCIYNNKLYVLGLPSASYEGHLWEYDPDTDGFTRITSFDGQSVSAKSIAAYGGKLYIGGQHTGDATPRLAYASGSLASWTIVTNPSGVTRAVSAMQSFQQKLYVAYGTKVWRLKSDLTWDGSTVFYEADQNSESNDVVGWEVHLGFLYGISNNGHIHRTDGNTTFDIWNWDGNTRGVAIKSFDGRLFVATYEYTNTDQVGYGVLYQMSGSAMTELKRWGKDTESNIIGSLTAYDRKLWYGASNLLGLDAGFGAAVYDPVEDAHSIFASNVDTVTYSRGSAPYVNDIVDVVTFFHGKLFALVRGHGAFITPYKPFAIANGTALYDISAAGGTVGPQNGGWFTTSTYDAGTPGLRKLWRKVIIDYVLPSTNQQIVVEYSTDNGANYTEVGTITTAGARLRQEYWLENVISVSFKLRITLRSTVSTQTPLLLGYTVSYLPIPEPNWQWSFTIVLAENQVLLDGTIEAVDTEAELAFLRDMYRTKQLVTFTDADGTLWATGGQPGVLVQDVKFLLMDLTQPIEGEVQVTLLESVETY